MRFEAVSTTSRIFPSEVASSATGRLYTDLKSISAWSGPSARSPADKDKPTKTAVIRGVDLAIRPGFVHVAVRATFPIRTMRVGGPSIERYPKLALKKQGGLRMRLGFGLWTSRWKTQGLRLITTPGPAVVRLMEREAERSLSWIFAPATPG